MAGNGILFSLAALAIVCFVLGEVIGQLNPKISRFIQLMGILLAVSAVVDKVIDIFSKIKSLANGL